MPDVLRDPRRRLDDRVEVDACFDFEAIEHVDQIFAGEISRCPRRVGAAAKAAG
jgi:hypothetical protein